MDRLKVLIIPSWYPSKENTIKGIFFKEQAESLGRYVNVAVLNLKSYSIYNPKKLLASKHETIYKENGVTTFVYSHVGFKSDYVNSKIYIKVLVEAFSVICKKWGEPDIIHAHVSYPAGYAGLILSQKFKIPFIVTEHASYFEDILLKKEYKYTSKVLACANHYTAVSNYLAECIKKTGRPQCDVIPNFIDVNKIKHIDRNQTKNNITQFNLLNVSSMTSIKGIDILLEALHVVVFQYGYKNIFLNIIGDGMQKKEYENLANVLNLSSYCSFHGRVDNDKVIDYMNNSNALVISSRKETFSVVGIEALAVGLPIISTRCGGPEDYIGKEVGILVENENVDSLAEGIILLITNYNHYNAQKIEDYFMKNYSNEIVCQKIVSIYNKVLASTIR